FLERERAGDLERDLGRVDAVIAAEEAFGLEVDHGEAGDDPALRRLLDALVDRGDELAGDDAADDRVDEVVALATPARAEPHVAVAELTAPARLFLVPAMALGGGPDRFTIGDPRLLHGDRYAVLPL